jgi:hypothetical protein
MPEPRRASAVTAASAGSSMPSPGPGRLPQAGVPSITADVLRSPGRQLDPPARAFFQPRFGTDFGHVTIHNDEKAADSADALNARAYTSGNHVAFGPGEYAPSTDRGLRLLAHELTHVVQQGHGQSKSAIQRQPKPAPAPAATDPQSRLTRSAGRIRTQALPMYQRGLDGLAPEVVEEAGSLVMLLWATIEGAHAELRPPDGPDVPDFVEIRKDVLAGVTIQKFRGADVAGPPRPVEHTGDVGQYIATQKAEAAATVKDAVKLVALLGKPRVEYEDEEAVVHIFRDRPNPWQFGYLRAVIDQAGLSPVLSNFKIPTHDDLETIFASQQFILTHAGPADRIGVLQPMPAEGKVRVLRPYGARELAVELYQDPDFYERVLLPYNRGALKNLLPEGLVPAGTDLAVDPRLLWGRYKLAFMAVEMTRSQIDRPYIEAAISGAAIKGTTVRYTVRWPVPPAPETAWRTSTGEVLWEPITKQWEAAELAWSVENDPAKGGGEESLATQAVRMETLTKSGSSVDRPWPEIGTYTVRCHVAFGNLDLPQGFDLRYTQPVVTEKEKVEAEWPTIKDWRQPQIYSRTADTYAEFQQAAQELGVSEDELAANPRLAGQFGLRTAYYPEFLLRDLRQQLEATDDSAKKSKLKELISTLENAIQRTKGWMRPIRGMYISSENDRTSATPLTAFVSLDFEAPRSHPCPLRFYDFTTERPRDYTDEQGEVTWQASLRSLLKAFAHDSPYPTGTVRFWVDSSLFPPELLGDERIAPEVLDFPTRGGSRFERLAPAILTLGAVALGIAIAGPEVALTAFAIYGAITGLADIISRLADGSFEFDLRTGLDLLAIVGGLAAGVSPVISAVRGVGQVAWLGQVVKTAGILQLGVMVGTHFNHLLKAVQSGDWDQIMDAAAAAMVDGAFVAVTHVMSKAGQAEARGRTVGDPVFEGVQGGTPRVDPSQGPGLAPALSGEQPSQAPAPPPEPPPMLAREQTPREAHEQWAHEMAQTGLSPRAAPAAPAGPAVGAGAYKSVAGELAFPTADAAFKAYDEALARAGGREVGIFRNTASPHGEYAVVVGDEHSVKPPDTPGKWESVLHQHPNPENVLTRRMPAPQDVANTRGSAREAGRPVTEFIDYPLPDGRRALVAYTVEPSGRVTLRFQRADGSTVVRTFETVQEYASHYSERTTYVDPKSPEYQWMMKDLDEFYSPKAPSGESTAVGVYKPEPTTETPAVKPPEGPPAAKGAEAEPAVNRAQLEKQLAAKLEQKQTNAATIKALDGKIAREAAKRDARLKAIKDLEEK